VPYWLPNSVFLNSERTEAALRNLHSSGNDPSPGNGCIGPAGSSHWKAAAGGSARHRIDQHGAYLVVCSHEKAHAAFPLKRPETIRGHHVLALAVAFALFCKGFHDDVTCILQKSVGAGPSGRRDVSRTLQTLFCDDKPDHGDCDASSVANVSDAQAYPVVLKLANMFADFVFCTAEEDEPLADDVTRPEGVDLPTVAADFDLPRLGIRLLRRAKSRDNTITASVPALHAYGHQCSSHLGAWSTPGVGNGSEWIERCFAQVLLVVMHRAGAP